MMKKPSVSGFQSWWNVDLEGPHMEEGMLGNEDLDDSFWTPRCNYTFTKQIRIFLDTWNGMSTNIGLHAQNNLEFH